MMRSKTFALRRRLAHSWWPFEELKHIDARVGRRVQQWAWLRPDEAEQTRRPRACGLAYSSVHGQQERPRRQQPVHWTVLVQVPVRERVPVMLVQALWLLPLLLEVEVEVELELELELEPSLSLVPR